jgi:hypothetical protein
MAPHVVATGAERDGLTSSQATLVALPTTPPESPRKRQKIKPEGSSFGAGTEVPGASKDLST